MKFTGPRIAKDQQEALEHYSKEDTPLIFKISDALKSAEVALVCYANVKGELAVGKIALAKIREVRGSV